jgi:hypothetical protein
MVACRAPMSPGHDDTMRALSSLIEAELGSEPLAALMALLQDRRLSVVSVLSFLAGAGRRTGNRNLGLTPACLEELRAAGYAAQPCMALATLLRSRTLWESCVRLDPGLHLELLQRAYRTGSNEERCALLITLPLLPDAARFCAVAEEACRTHVLDVFEAIACENPYAARYFGAASFDQMVIKALFMGSHLGRILGLDQRNTPELRRMVRAFASERRAAGRPIPPDVALVEPNLETPA